MKKIVASVVILFAMFFVVPQISSADTTSTGKVIPITVTTPTKGQSIKSGDLVKVSWGSTTAFPTGSRAKITLESNYIYSIGGSSVVSGNCKTKVTYVGWTTIYATSCGTSASPGAQTYDLVTLTCDVNSVTCPFLSGNNFQFIMPSTSNIILGNYKIKVESLSADASGNTYSGESSVFSIVPPSTKLTATITADDNATSETVPFGSNVNLAWTSTGASYCTIDNGFTHLSGGADNNGGGAFGPATASKYTTTFQCYDSKNKSVKSSVTVKVLPPTTQATSTSASVSAPTASLTDDQSVDFSQYGSTVPYPNLYSTDPNYTSPTTLYFAAQNATACILSSSPRNQSWNGTISLDQSSQSTAHPVNVGNLTTDTTFTVTCINSGKKISTKGITVHVESTSAQVTASQKVVNLGTGENVNFNWDPSDGSSLLVTNSQGTQVYSSQASPFNIPASAINVSGVYTAKACDVHTNSCGQDTFTVFDPTTLPTANPNLPAPHINAVTPFVDTNGTIQFIVTGIGFLGSNPFVDGQSATYSASSLTDTSVTLLSVKQLAVAGTHTVYLVNSTTGQSNTITFQSGSTDHCTTNGSMGTYACSSVVLPTIAVSSMPTLKLNYDSAHNESSLVATYVLNVSAGSQSISFAKNQGGLVQILQKLSGGQGVSAGADPQSTAFTSNATFDGTNYTIPASQTKTITITSTYNPQVLFAGAYYGIFNDLKLNDGTFIDTGKIPATPTVTIIGKTSPYISNITSPVSLINGTVTITGSLFSPSQTLFIGDNNAIRLAVNGNGINLSSDRKTISVTPSLITSFNVVAGVYSVHVVDPIKGNSNNVNLTLTGTTPTAPALVCTNLTRGMDIGATGSDVSALQTFLRAKGFLPTTFVQPSGIYDTATGNAVNAFRTVYNIAPTGTGIGPIAEAKIKALSCPDTSVTPTFTFTSPNGGTCTVGQVCNITWTSTGVTNISLGIIRPEGGLNLSQNVPASNGSYAWTIPATFATGTYYAQAQTVSTAFNGNTFSIVAAPAVSCSISTDKNSYNVGDIIVYSWTSQNASSVSWQRGSTLTLPTGNLGANGSSNVTASVEGSQTVNLAATGTGGSGICAKTVSIVALALTNHASTGYLDSITNNTIYGWTVDPDAPTVSNQVDIYIDGAYAQGGTLIGRFTANVARPDVTAGIPQYTGNHGYAVAVPSQYQDGKQHSVYAYGIDTAGGPNTLLTNSPKTFTIGTSVVATPAVPNPTVTLTTTSGVSGSETIANGATETLNWSSTNAIACALGYTPSLTALNWTGAVGTSGSKSVSAGATYTVTCTNSAGAQATASFTLTVSVPPQSSTATSPINTNSAVTTMAPPSAPALVCTNITRGMDIGATGTDVTALQIFLMAKGFLPTTFVPSTKYDTATGNGVYKFRAAYNVTPIGTGIGPIAEAKIKSLSCGTTLNSNSSNLANVISPLQVYIDAMRKLIQR